MSEKSSCGDIGNTALFSGTPETGPSSDGSRAGAGTGAILGSGDVNSIRCR